MTTGAARAPVDEPSSGSRVAGRALGRIGARAVSSLAFGATLAMVARLTTLPQFGILMLAYSIGLVVGILVGFGAPARVLRAGAEHKTTPGALYIVYATFVTASFMVCVLLYSVIAPSWAAYAGLTLALGDTLVNFSVAHMTAEDRHVVANSLVLFHRLVPLLAVVIGYFALHDLDFSTLTIVLGIPVLVALVIPAIFSPIRESARQWRISFTGSGGYWAYSISALIGQLQIPLLAIVTSASVVATYTMAARVVGPMSILTASVSVIVVPELVKRVASPPGFERLFRGVLGLSVIYLVIATIAAWPIAELVVYVVGPQYLAAEPIVIGMVIGAGISGCSQAFNSRLLAVGQPFASSMAITAGALIALVVLAALGLAGLVNTLWLVPIITEIVVIVVMVMASRNLNSNSPMTTSVTPKSNLV